MNGNARLAIVTVVLAVGGCTAPPAPRGVVPTGGPPVIVPGGPGEAAATATPGQTLAPPGEPNAADVRFAEAMIPHHRQALDMAALAPARTTSQPVLAAAARIELSQQPEISWLSTWLMALGRTPPHGHGHDLTALRAARGTAFDRLFLRDMITHHEGALEMAATVLREGADPAIRRLAADIDQSQSAEIARMRSLLG